MRNRLHHKLLRRLQLRESWIIFFIMGIIMMNFPFLHIFNKANIVLGFPIFFLYLFVGWAVSIFVIYLFTLAIGHNEVRQRENRKH
ncbi:hypothetical protein [Pelotalea chapellei]|uniref:DUF4212 domain-containing protein n=1 Tax=Pelotalea chapellei TaxID=44671 RepID=A0ABS5U812_9BACT|nr:hypothetical protein [Pelotalea chapellei]MBT1071805.1 hypothetical protein [Pelotalea chapellei]